MVVHRNTFGVTPRVTPSVRDDEQDWRRVSGTQEELLARLNAELGTSGTGTTRTSREMLERNRAQLSLDEQRASALSDLARSSAPMDEGMIANLTDKIGKLAEPVKDINPFRRLVSDNPVTNFVKEKLPDSWVNAIGSANNAVGEWIGYAAGTPARFVESAAKELSDLGNAYDFETGTFFDSDKDQFSWVDFFKQGMSPDFDPVYAPVENVGRIFDRDWSENGFVTGVDSVLNIGAKVVADPITYTGLSPVRYGGRAGRAALADDLRTIYSRSDNIDDAQLAAELGNAYRYGEFGLSPRSRELLVINGLLDPQGIRWAGRTVPNTGGAARAIGQPLVTTRAEIGDKIPRLASATTPRSLKGLEAVARGTSAGTKETLGAFAVQSANKIAQAESSRAINSISTRYRESLRNLGDSRKVRGEEGFREINNFMEGVTDEISEDLRPFAEVARQIYDDALETVNASRAALNEQYDLNLAPITRLDNYVHRTLSPSARMARFSLRGDRRRRFNQAVKELGITPEKLNSNEGFTMARTKNKSFMGVQLRNNSIDEYNRIAVDKLGYKLFEDNSGLILKNYLDSAGRQLRREYFVSNLLKRYPEGIKRFLGKGTGADAAVTTPKGVSELIDLMTTELDKLTNEVVVRRGARSLTGDVLAQVRQVRSALIAQGSEAFKASSAVGRKARAAATKMRQRADELAEYEQVAREKGADAMREYDSLIRPLLARIEVLANALDAEQSVHDVAMRWLREKHEAVFPNAVQRPTTAEGLADDILDDAQSRLRGAARRNVERKAREARAAGSQRTGKQGGRKVEVDGVTMRVTDAKRELKVTRKQYDGAKKAFQKFADNDPTFKDFARGEMNFNRAAAAFDVASALAGTADDWNRIVGDLYRADIESVTDLIRTAPRSGESLDANVEWVRKVQSTLDSLEALDVPEGEKEALRRVFAQLFADEGHLSRIDALVDDLPRLQQAEDLIVKELESGEWAYDLQDGWTALSNLQVQISPELNAQVSGIYQDLDKLFLQMKDPQAWTAIGELFRTVNSYFKTTALLTVGYGIRNSVTAAFNNWSMGVTNAQMGRGVNFAIRVRQVGLDKALAEIQDVGQRKIMEDAYLAVQMSGGGNFIDEVFPRIGREKRRYNNQVANTVYRAGDYLFRPTAGRLSSAARNANQNIELAMRMGMAIDGIEKGMGVAGAAGRITRVQFDYTDLSQLDEFVKTFIPFWVFASRNIPLQITNRVLRPSAYNVYDTIAEYDDELSEDLPLWRSRRNPLKLPFGEWYLDLDLPFQSLSESFEEMTTSRGLIGQVTPVIRSPLEAAFGSRIAFGESIPYSDDLRPAGTDLPLAAVSSMLPLFGGTLQRDAQGRIVTSDASVEPLKGALPAFTNLQKYLIGVVNAFTDTEGKDDEDSVARQILGGSGRLYDREFLNSFFQATGSGLFRLTEPMKEGELRRRQYDIRELQEELRQLGYTE